MGSNICFAIVSNWLTPRDLLPQKRCHWYRSLRNCFILRKRGLPLGAINQNVILLKIRRHSLTLVQLIAHQNFSAWNQLFKARHPLSAHIKAFVSLFHSSHLHSYSKNLFTISITLAFQNMITVTVNSHFSRAFDFSKKPYFSHYTSNFFRKFF